MLYSVLLTELLILFFLFSTTVKALVVVKLVIFGISTWTSFILALREALVSKLVKLDISPLTSLILALRVVLVATLVISGILFSIFFILALYTSFLTTSFFTQHHLIYLNRQEQVIIYQHLIYPLYCSNCLN